MLQRYLIVSYLLLATALNLKATHIVGGELNYKFINDSTYQLSLKVYRDCFLGVPLFDNPAFINIFDGNNVYQGRITIPRPAWDTLPIVLTDPCLVAPPDVCVESVNYLITTRLPVNETGYQLAYQRCCRNSTILNAYDDRVNLPDSSGGTYNCIIPPVSQVRNSNPVFNNFPPVAICANRLLEFDHSAQDSDGDSLVYKLCTPLDGLTSGSPTIALLLEFPPYDTIRWRAPYSLIDMLSGPQPLSIHPTTGLLTAIPGRIGQFVVGVCVEEYRGGAFLSETRRDFQFNVADCAKVVRSFFSSVDTSCNNRTIPFINQSTNSSSFFWDFGDGSASSDVNPTHTYSEYGTYQVMLISNPGSECVDTFIKTIYITQDNLIITSPDISSCSNQNFNIQLSAQNGSIAYVVWSVNGENITRQGNTIQLLLNQSQTISYTAYSSQGCSYEGTVNVNIIPAPEVLATANPITILPGELVNLNATVTSGYQYQWSPATLVANATSPTTTSQPLQDQWFTVTVTDPLTGCKTLDSVFVNVLTCEDSLNINVDISSDGLCNPQTVLFEASSALEGVSYQWIVANEVVSTSDTFSTTFLNAQIFILQLIASKEGLCSDTINISYPVTFDEISYNSEDVILCVAGEVLIDLDIQSDFGYEVFWQHLNGQAGTGDSLLILIDKDTVLAYTIVLDNGCIISDEVRIEISKIDITASADKSQVRPGETVQLFALPDNGYSFSWTPQQLLNNPAIINPTAIVLATTLFVVEAVDTNGCIDTASVLVVVVDEEICDEFTLFIPSAFSPNGDGKNDIWKIRGQAIESIDVMVYNRWGQKVFESTDPTLGWDGLYKGQIADGEVFGYYAKVWCVGGLELVRKGNITLLR